MIVPIGSIYLQSPASQTKAKLLGNPKETQFLLFQQQIFSAPSTLGQELCAKWVAAGKTNKQKQMPFQNCHQERQLIF